VPMPKPQDRCLRALECIAQRRGIDQFEAVMEREGEGGRQRGFFVSFGDSRDAEQECAAFHKRTGRIVKLLTVQEILDEEHVQKM